MRRALKELLQARRDIDVVAEAADTQELMEQAKVAKPDVVLLDSELLNGPQEDLVARLRQARCKAKVVVLGFAPDLKQAAQAAGSDAFVSKGDPPKAMLTTLYRVHLEGRE